MAPASSAAPVPRAEPATARPDGPSQSPDGWSARPPGPIPGPAFIISGKNPPAPVDQIVHCLLRRPGHRGHLVLTSAPPQTPESSHADHPSRSRVNSLRMDHVHRPHLTPPLGAGPGQRPLPVPSAAYDPTRGDCNTSTRPAEDPRGPAGLACPV
jgi:hypothetical protein